MDRYLTHRKEAKAPSFKPSGLACDCHMHIFGPAAEYQYTNQRNFTPHDASVAEYARIVEVLGLGRAVVVQASVYGTDNRRTADAVEELGLKRARGIAMVDANVDRNTLRDLNNRSIRDTRFITTVKGGPSPDNLPGVAKKDCRLRLAHRDVYPAASMDRVATAGGRTACSGCVRSHGRANGQYAESSPELQSMLRLLESGYCWVKLCGYRASIAGHPYSDVEPLAKRFIVRAPERCVWGTDWPHTTLTEYMPDDGDLMDLLAKWVPDADLRRKILVDNAEELYDF